ncbi:MAG: YjbH domain-containing protein [candidate division KSB1 bacterium]|nr:YjbH domain-containing protein [candidate division KSB1 bacterium]MDZ7304646.1 YjbH domain-containing protein [candidate division KSB1 bacterium]MDZ7313778.1 YjbH domain-containing protein [candidate division KSB1 bacterium]
MKKTTLLLLLLLPVSVIGQGIEVPPRHIIDFPTAWPLPRAGFDLNVRFFGMNGAIVSMNVGVSGQFMFGASYGGTNILGEDSLHWNPAPGLLVRYQLIGESFALPAISVGFESQGYGSYVDSTKRYTNKSPGFYVVASKSYALLERLDFHGGVNYSLERGDKDRDINLFVGATLAVNQDFEILGEYDFAINDNKEKVSLGSGAGYLNSGLRLNIKKVVYLELFVKNLLQNKRDAKYFNREFKITFFQYIL